MQKLADQLNLQETSLSTLMEALEGDPNVFKRGYKEKEPFSFS